MVNRRPAKTSTLPVNPDHSITRSSTLHLPAATMPPPSPLAMVNRCPTKTSTVSVNPDNLRRSASVQHLPGPQNHQPRPLVKTQTLMDIQLAYSTATSVTTSATPVSYPRTTTSISPPSINTYPPRQPTLQLQFTLIHNPPTGNPPKLFVGLCPVHLPRNQTNV